MWFWITMLCAARAEGRVGVDWVPMGRADVVAAVDGATSGTGLSEFDGVLRPPLTAWAGWQNGQNAWLWGMAVGWNRTANHIGQTTTVSSRGAIRPSVDLRHYIEHESIAPWVQAGIYGTVPWARESSDLYTAEEQDALAVTASADRGRIAGYGIRVGGGAEIILGDGLSIGARWATVFHQGIVNSEDGIQVATRLFPEAAFTMGWRL